MTTTVYLVRHGSHDLLGRMLCGRMPGVVLSATGEAEARACGLKLAGRPISAVYASPMERAAQTAAMIAEAVGVEPVTDDAIDEINFGEWTGASFDDLDSDPRWAQWNGARREGRTPGGESAEEAQYRIAGWLSSIEERHPETAVVAVSHADIIKFGLCFALGLDLDFHDRFEISPASISVVATGDWGMKVHSINEAPA